MRVMQLWLTHRSEVPIRDQLVAQIVLGILSNDLKPGHRLPSTRELARRFNVHPNTVSAGYRRLEKESWVEFRRGSGVYVRGSKPDEPLDPFVKLDQLIRKFLQAARELGLRSGEVRSRVRQWMEMQPPDHFLLIEPDEELRKIAVAEMQAVARMPVTACGPHDARALRAAIEGAISVAFPNRESKVRALLGPDAELLILRGNSVPGSLASWLPARANALIGIASRWENFLTLAKTVLIAAGFDADALLLRDARNRNWAKGLEQSTAVVCDTLTAASLANKCRVIPFPLIAQSSLDELRQYESVAKTPGRV